MVDAAHTTEKYSENYENKFCPYMFNITQAIVVLHLIDELISLCKHKHLLPTKPFDYNNATLEYVFTPNQRNR